MEQKTQNTPPRTPAFFTRGGVVLVALLALGALALFLWNNRAQNAAPSTSGAAVVAVATIGRGEAAATQQIDLAKNGIVHIEGGLLPVQLEVKDGAVRFVHSVCPDHDCEGFGWLKAEGDWAACLPAQVVLEIHAA